MQTDEPKRAVPFCSVAEAQPRVKGDPARTLEMKAYHNELGKQLCSWENLS